MLIEGHKHIVKRRLTERRRERAREKVDNRRPLVACPKCGKMVRGLEQHAVAMHSRRAP